MGFIQNIVRGLPLFALLLSSLVQARIIAPNDYQYPFVPPLEATVAGSFFKAPGHEVYENIKISPSIHQRKSNDLELRYYPPVNNLKTSDELVFVFSGIGGDSKGNISNFLSLQLAKKGLHAVIVPSFFTEDFVLSFSRTGYVGHLPNDAKDMMNALVRVLQKLEHDKGLNFKKIKLAGYSLGALCAAHVAHHSDTTAASLKFEKVVLVNSPIDLLYGLRYLDKAKKEGTNLTLLRLVFGVFRPLIDIFMHFRQTEFITEEIFEESVRELENLDLNDVKALIAKALGRSLSDVIMGSQRLHDLGILPRLPNLYDDMRRRTAIYKRRVDAAKKMGFEQYARKILIPYYKYVLNQKDFSLEKLNKDSSLTALNEYFKRSKHIYFIHNTDDFLIKDSSEVFYFDDLFKEKATFFPRGGHLGNIWYKENVNVFLDYIDAN